MVHHFKLNPVPVVCPCGMVNALRFTAVLFLIPNLLRGSTHLHPIFSFILKHAFRGGVSSQIGKTIGLKRSRLSLLGTRRGDSSPHTVRFQTAWKQPTLGVDAFLVHMMHISCDFNFQLSTAAIQLAVGMYPQQRNFLCT